MWSSQASREKSDTMDVDLTDKITNVFRTMVPMIVEETLRKVQGDRRAQEETEEKSGKLEEDEKDCRREKEDLKLLFVALAPEFHGILDPIVVSNWIMEIENTFEICKVSDDRKVLYASSRLKGNALYWWNTVKPTCDVKVISWDEFKELVYKKYSPKSLIEKLEEEFTNLNQGRMSVQEYTTKFTEKARFVAASREIKIMRFIEGLETKIQCLVAKAEPKTMEEAVEQALIAEKDCTREREESIRKRIQMMRRMYAVTLNGGQNCVYHICA